MLVALLVLLAAPVDHSAFDALLRAHVTVHWYREDFGGSNEALGRYLARYWPEGKERALLLSGRFRLRETRYDWSLNGVPAGKPGR